MTECARAAALLPPLDRRAPYRSDYPFKQPGEDSLAYYDRVARLADLDEDYQQYRQGAQPCPAKHPFIVVKTSSNTMETGR